MSLRGLSNFLKVVRLDRPWYCRASHPGLPEPACSGLGHTGSWLSPRVELLWDSVGRGPEMWVLPDMGYLLKPRVSSRACQKQMAPSKEVIEARLMTEVFSKICTELKTDNEDDKALGD